MIDKLIRIIIFSAFFLLYFYCFKLIGELFSHNLNENEEYLLVLISVIFARNTVDD